MANIAESYTSWFKSEEYQDKMWRAGRSPSENSVLGLLSGVVFGSVYDGPIKLAIKSSKTAAETLQAPGLEYLQEIEAKWALEKGLADTEQGGCDAILASAVNFVEDDIVSTSRRRTAPRSPIP